LNDLNKYSKGKVVPSQSINLTPVVKEEPTAPKKQPDQPEIYDKIVNDGELEFLTKSVKEKAANLSKPKTKDLQNGRKIVVIVPITIPGIGKTSLIDSHLKPCLKNQNLVTISKDDIRKDCIDKWMK